MGAIKILTCGFAMPSTRLLKEALENRTGRRTIITTNPRKVFWPSFLRYGNAEDVDIEDSPLNSTEFIKTVADKYEFSKLMAANNIYSPVFRQDEPNEEDYPLIIRKTLQSYGGRGIIVCENEDQFNDNWDDAYYWTPYVKNDLELRVHVLGGKAQKIFKKIKEGEEKFPIRTSGNGYHFSLKNLETYPKVVEFVDSLKDVLTGQFYTLDVAWDKDKKQYMVFEANSASGLNTQTAALYADYLADKI
jgi:glutathione synthase/RimK-type ligase-like ATP-grasp enzyme